MPFREIRKARQGQALSLEDCNVILDHASHGVLALAGDEGYPYAVPLSYAREGDTLYFHSAVNGHKLDAIERCDKASFCVVDTDEVEPEEFTTYYRSVIAWGRVSVLTHDGEKRRALTALADKYCRAGICENYDEKLAAEIDKSWGGCLCFKLEIEHVSGKASKELKVG